MKRVLMFLLLFGAGLGLLLYLSKEQKKENQERLSDETEQIVKDGSSETRRQVPEVPPSTTLSKGGSEDPSGITIRATGEFMATQFDEKGVPLQDFHADNVQPLEGNLYELTGITARIYNRVTDKAEKPPVNSTLVAQRCLAKLERDSEGKWTVGQTERIQVFDAVVTLHTGSPMAPLDLILPVAEADLRTNSFYSDTEVRVEGEGIQGTATGLIVEQGIQRLQLTRDGYVRLVAEEGAVVELFAAPASPIVFRGLQPSAGVEKVEIRLDRGGRLVASGDKDVTVEGNKLNLIGRIFELKAADPSNAAASKRKRGFLAEFAEVRGRAKFTRDLERVTGGYAEVRFDARGQVKHMQMSESPVASGVFELEMPGAPKGPVPVRIFGVGPMALEYNDDSPSARFELPGPATIEAPERNFVLHTARAIEGSFWGRGLLHLSLHGAVDGVLGDMKFVGSEIEVRGSQLDATTPRLFLETKTPAHLTGLDSRGKPVDIKTQNLLQLELNQGRALVLLGRDVTFQLEDHGLWTVTVGELRNLDVEQGTFEASGGVVYTGPLGSGTAVRASGHSREHIELFGDEERPATYDVYPDTSPDLDLGFVRARHIDLQKTKASADTSVELHFSGNKFSEEAQCAWFEIRPLGEASVDGPQEFEFEAREITKAVLQSHDAESVVRADRIDGAGLLTRDAESGSSFELQRLEASGNVTVDYKGSAGNFTAKGGRIEWRPDGGGRLEAPVGERVEARGRFQQDGLPYVLTAAWIEYKGGELQALFPEITLDRPAALPQILLGRATTELYSGSGEWMTADEEGVMLSGSARFSGKSAKGEKIELDAGSIHLRRAPKGDGRTQGVQEMVAWDGFDLRVGTELVSRGDLLQVGYDMLRMEGRPAQLEMLDFLWESDNIVYDVPQVLITTDQGRIRGIAGGPAEGLDVTYESLQPFETEDSTLLVMRNPVMRSDEREIRANWATFWLDRDEWLHKTQQWLTRGDPLVAPVPANPSSTNPSLTNQGQGQAAPTSSAPTLFGRLDSKAISKVLKEIYFEGDMVYTSEGKTVARMQAAYVDVVDGHGWIQDCEIFINAKIGRVRTDLAIRAEWLRHSADGTLSADHAEVTACDFADPHYFISTKNLRLTPTGGGSSVWDVLLKDNALVFDNGIKVPLPRVHYKSDGKGRPTFSGLRFGDSARFGTFIEASLDLDVGQTVLDTLAPMLNATPDEIDGRYRIRASYYNSRGLLLDQRFRLTAAEHFWMNVYLDGLYDTGEDRGMVRYKTPGQDGFRWVLSTRSRYILTDDEWFDFVYATQSDPGVQAEFSEGQFINYESRDTYVRWRNADDENYYSAEVRVRANSFRNDVERLPDIGVMRGLTPFAEIGGQPLLYTASADVAYLRRREGTNSLLSPFDPVFNDGLGNREVVRGDTRHRVESPFELGAAGIRVSPFITLEGTTWSEGVDPATSPTRGAVMAGAEAETSLFKTYSHGVVNTVTPFVGYRGDLVSFEDDGQQLKLDNVDESISGRFADAGLRSRWRVPGGARYLDLSVRGTHADTVEVGEEDGWRPLRVLGELLASYEGIPFAISHDANYDVDDGETTLSFTSLSLLPHHDVGVELAYYRGRDDNRALLYDAVSLGARWDATTKWQFEASQTLSRLDNSNLSSDFLIRRLGHDFVFELSYGFRSGEGGNTLTFKYRPLLGWREPTFGYMQTLQRTQL